MQEVVIDKDKEDDKNDEISNGMPKVQGYWEYNLRFFDNDIKHINSMLFAGDNNLVKHI